MAGGDEAGGSLSLARLIDDHGDALVYDLLAFGIDLHEYVWGVANGIPQQFGPGRLMLLITWLPEGSAFYASMRGGAHWRAWSNQAEIVASLWDLQYAKATAGSKKAKKAHYPRPKKPTHADGKPRDIMEVLPPGIAKTLKQQAADRKAAKREAG